MFIMNKQFHTLFIVVLSSIISIICFIPVTICSNNDYNLKDNERNELENSVNSYLYIHASLGVVCVCIPLIFDILCDWPFAQARLFSTAQMILLFSVFCPSLIIYITGSTNTLSLGKNVINAFFAIKI